MLRLRRVVGFHHKSSIQGAPNTLKSWSWASWRESRGKKNTSSFRTKYTPYISAKFAKDCFAMAKSSFCKAPWASNCHSRWWPFFCTNRHESFQEGRKVSSRWNNFVLEADRNYKGKNLSWKDMLWSIIERVSRRAFVSKWTTCSFLGVWGVCMISSSKMAFISRSLKS